MYLGGFDDKEMTFLQRICFSVHPNIYVTIERIKDFQLFMLYRKELGNYEDTPKTKGSVRYIRLPDQTMELLAEYHRWYKEEKFRWGDKWEDKDYLFPRENGAPMFPGYVCNWLDAFSKRHGLPHRTHSGIRRQVYCSSMESTA